MEYPNTCAVTQKNNTYFRHPGHPVRAPRANLWISAEPEFSPDKSTFAHRPLELDHLVTSSMLARRGVQQLVRRVTITRRVSALSSTQTTMADEKGTYTTLQHNRSSLTFPSAHRRHWRVGPVPPRQPDLCVGAAFLSKLTLGARSRSRL